MKIHRNILAILFLLFSHLQSQTVKHNASINFAGERLKFSMNYLNLNVATLKFTVADSNSNMSEPFYQLLVTARSNPFASKLFKIKNKYSVLFATNNFLPIQSIKKIDQKNIQHNVVQKFDHHEQQATFNDSITWSLPTPCYDYFSMLYFLRSQPLKSSDTLSFFLDSEYLILKVMAIILPESSTIKTPYGKFKTIKIQLSFEAGTKVERPWKTDIITNRLAKPGSKLNIWLSDDRLRLPLKISYYQSLIKTTIKLISFSKGHPD